MIKHILFFILILTFTIQLTAQKNEIEKARNCLSQKGEVYFCFRVPSKSEIKELTRYISIDNYTQGLIYAYANEKQFQQFLTYGYSFNVLTHPGERLKNPKMYMYDQKSTYSFTTYPTYESYINIMYQFQNEFPDLCQIIEIGQSVMGRKIVFAKISDQVTNSEAEPLFMYTSTMHGDETAGYILMLRLIHHLLSQYGQNSEITQLINTTEIWINPLANPDGTYASGNSTVYGATRYNANHVDLNRNFQDPEDGPHPDGNNWQPETQAFMNLGSQYSFVMSVNFHGGAEVVSYPWDTWGRMHTDDSWYQYIAHNYANTAQANSPSGYMDGFNDGIVNGYDWYEVNGGRQDYMIYYNHCRELTIELSDIKLVNESQLENLWNYNSESLINYIKEVHFGINGFIRDKLTKEPVMAEIFIPGHDNDNSEVYSNSDFGDFYRPIYAGNYTLSIHAENYPDQAIQATAVNGQTTELVVELDSECPVDLLITENITGGQRTYLAMNSITASNRISGGSNVKYRANNTVRLRNGFKVSAGNTFLADRNGCTITKSNSSTNTFTDINNSNIYHNVIMFGEEPAQPNRSAIEVYPNPSWGIFNLVLNIKSETSEIMVYNLSGELVLKYSSEAYQEILDLSDMPEGIYILKVINESTTFTRKLIKE